MRCEFFREVFPYKLFAIVLPFQAIYICSMLCVSRGQYVCAYLKCFYFPERERDRKRDRERERKFVKKLDFFLPTQRMMFTLRISFLLVYCTIRSLCQRARVHTTLLCKELVQMFFYRIVYFVIFLLFALHFSRNFQCLSRSLFFATSVCTSFMYCLPYSCWRIVYILSFSLLVSWFCSFVRHSSLSCIFTLCLFAI